MPRTIDEDERRTTVAEAVWRVTHRDGLDAASVRSVALEAGLSTGSLRHYFASQRDLQVFAMELVMQRITQRVGGLCPDDPPEVRVRALLREFLPLDEERVAESEVWLAFTARALVDPALRSVRDRAYDLLGVAVRQAIDTLAAAGALGADLDRDLETRRLYALVDGLLLHGVLRPAVTDAAVMTAVLERHLESLSG